MIGNNATTSQSKKRCMIMSLVIVYFFDLILQNIKDFSILSQKEDHSGNMKLYSQLQLRILAKELLHVKKKSFQKNNQKK